VLWYQIVWYDHRSGISERGDHWYNHLSRALVCGESVDLRTRRRFWRRLRLRPCYNSFGNDRVTLYVLHAAKSLKVVGLPIRWWVLGLGWVCIQHGAEVIAPAAPASSEKALQTTLLVHVAVCACNVSAVLFAFRHSTRVAHCAY